MNTFVRLLLPLGLVVFGAVAAFMGVVVLATSLPSGEITTGIGATATRAGSIATLARATNPAGYWRAVLLLGALPALGGLAAAVGGWRMLSGGRDDG